jgi:serine/threonine protein kinase
MAAHEICPRCRGELPADAPEGLCPECLLRQSLEAPGAGLDPAGDTGPYDRGFVPLAPADLARHFPHLEILEFVGKGGMGAVYRARQPGLDRLVAVKVLPPEVARDPAFAERFSREARSLARFNHPNIVTIYDFGETGGLYYIIMEFVAGRNLRQLLQGGVPSEARVLQIVAQVCDALQYAHDGGVVHRDIKPENILLDARGQVKIADFGLAKLVGLAPALLSLTGSHDVMGTVYYMAPEQLLRNLNVDHRADIYSLGVVFYEMLTGELPVGRFGPPGQRARVDARLDAIVLRALESKPEHRYQDAAEIKRDVEAVLAGPLAPAAAGANWPCVRFTIPNVTWTCARVEGEMYRDETTLILDFSVVGHTGSSAQKEVRIPLSEIRRISCHVPQWPGVPRWINAWRKAEIFVKVFDPAEFAELPVGRYGYVWGQLQVHRGDGGAAQELVDGILRSPLLGLGTPRPSGPFAALDRVRRQLRGPAWGLLLTAGAALVWTLGPAVVAAERLNQAEDVMSNRLVFAVATVLALVGVPPLFAGAVQMVRRRSYPLCVAAALVAVLPWSPAWLVGLPVGIWALVVLSRREVILAFLRERDDGALGPPRDPEPPGPVGRKLRSWWRSFAGVFITIPGPRSGTPREGASQNDG